ncbi:NDP-hexose 2,3-dehydratase family protein [Actinoalloteichus spitiensis]|uniref:NDP-hexose 2,3-dehydratase family protein n=1 Tax=Actinoalloteichus spitiensis TaxID=252394 RepID=UPI000365E586|nr:NDP-hexose 2,3-dehydratase family protein [Actinoalloteichus spitiensis]
MANVSDPAGQLRVARSALEPGRQFPHLAEFHRWFAATATRRAMAVHRVPLNDLTDWHEDPATGNIGHHTGGFFTVEALDVHLPDGPVPRWSQPIINQPEVGILGILVREIDGILHCLMQAKHEPGNHNGLQLSPTVQATRSNYTRVHQGRPVPYLRHFRDTDPRGVLADTRQSEQGAWFYRKRNRNMIVETTEDIQAEDGFCWLTLGQLHALLSVPDLVNMDARTVLACLPFSGSALAAVLAPRTADPFRAALVRSYDPAQPCRHGLDEVLSWITELRTATELRAERRPLRAVRDWRRVEGRISHDTGLFFDVVGVRVHAEGREVSRWDQPMIEPVGTGVVAFLARVFDGVLHVLVHNRTEPGYTDVTELAPTVQCVPDNYEHLPAQARPPLLDEVLTAPPERMRFDAVLSEEGGRFHGARNRYLVVETDIEVDLPDYRWLTLRQLGELLRHSFYLNVQARSLVICLHSLAAGAGGTGGERS